MSHTLTKYWQLHRLSILIVLASAGFYVAFAFFLERPDFIRLLTLFAVLFFFCIKLIQFEKWNFKFLLVAGILFRLVFLFAVPNLSQDYFRFLWDGQLILQGVNPYLFTPDQIMANGEVILQHAGALHEGMGGLSARHYSNYPPLNQLFFALASFLGGKGIMSSLVSMRIFIILADIGVYYFGKKILLRLNKSPHLIFWYFLNPLVIIELTGNLHFEGVMLFFFIWAMSLLSLRKWMPAAMLYGLSVALKLVPLMFLPLFLKYLGSSRSLGFYVISAMVFGMVLMPFYSPVFIEHYSSTLSLWFNNFEFNSSIYNLVKWIGIQWEAKPWELIKVYGKITPYLTIGIVLLLTSLRKNQKLETLFTSMLMALAFYFFLSTTVHPWYIIFLLILCIYTDYRFPILWSAVIILSYYAYSNPEVEESIYILAIEYLAVFGYLGYEFIRHWQQKSPILKK